MTQNERKTLEIIYNQKERVTIQLIANQMKLSAEYICLMCHSLERAGYLEFSGRDIYRLSLKGKIYFEKGDKEGEKREENSLQEIGGERSFDKIKDISPAELERLIKAGYTSIKEIAEAPISKVMQQLRVNVKKAAHWINQARQEIGMIREEDKEVEKQSVDQ